MLHGKKSVECGSHIFLQEDKGLIWDFICGCLSVDRGYKGGSVASVCVCLCVCVCMVVGLLKAIRVSKQQRKYPQEGNCC